MAMVCKSVDTLNAVGFKNKVWYAYTEAACDMVVLEDGTGGDSSKSAHFVELQDRREERTRSRTKRKNRARLPKKEGLHFLKCEFLPSSKPATFATPLFIKTPSFLEIKDGSRTGDVMQHTNTGA